MPKRSASKAETARRLATLLQTQGEPGESSELSMGDERAALTVRSFTVRTLDAALATSQVDLAVWEVERYVVNKWDMAAKVEVENRQKLAVTELWQVKVWLRRRVAKTMAEACAGIIDRMRQHAPKYPRLPTVPRITDPHLLVIGLYDHHFGKLAWGKETGEDYDLKIAEERFLEGGKQLLSKASGYPIERFVLPLGQDFLHIDSQANTTTAGTPQDVDGRFAKIIEVAKMAVIRLIDHLIAFAPVEVPWVPGNHDYYTSYMLAKIIEAWYRTTPRVIVDAAPIPRKRISYGVNLLGLTHGCDERHSGLPGNMAQEWPHDWAATRCREWLIGHQHKVKEDHYNTADMHSGVVVRVLPSLSGTDAWHYKRGYIGGRGKSALGLLYSKRDGFAGQFSTNVWRRP
jgi:hypothetical protein